MIRAYWNGNRLGKPSASEALLALARLLAFYTGHDEDRLERLILQSPLFASTEAERVKWTSRRRGGTWGRVYVVQKAISTCPTFYSGRAAGATRRKRPLVLRSALSSVAPPPV
jgi:hypothetical protein